jgi:hypothetical protein
VLSAALLVPILLLSQPDERQPRERECLARLEQDKKACEAAPREREKCLIRAHRAYDACTAGLG